MTQQPAKVPEFDTADRMRKALRQSDVGVQEMADYLDVSRNAVSNWINGRVQPGRQTLIAWALRTGVPLQWLERGGAPHPDGEGRDVDDELGRKRTRRYSKPQPSDPKSIPLGWAA